MACSISAPENPSQARARLASVGRGRARCRAWRGWMRRISARGVEVGQVDEEDLVEAALAQQLRRQRADVVGGGDDEHARCCFSAIQVRNEPSTRRDAPPSESPGRRSPSRSRRSTARTAPAPRRPPAPRAGCARTRRCTCRTARRQSSRSSGTLSTPAQALAARLLPQPCTPSSSTPLGASSSGAEPSKAGQRCCSQALRLARPPTSAGGRCRLVAQHAAVVQHFVLGAHHHGHVGGLDGAVVEDRLARQALRIGGRQAAHVLDQQLQSPRVDLDGLARVGAHPLPRHILAPAGDARRGRAAPGRTRALRCSSSCGISVA